MIFKKIEGELAQRTLDGTDRDWGQSIILAQSEDGHGKVVGREKFLIFKPGGSILLEKHMNYSEMWLGDSRFEYVLEDEHGNLNTHTAQPYERVFIPKGRKHKIICLDTLRIFEVQMGVIENSDKVQFKQ
jgi:hypothetical protein